MTLQILTRVLGDKLFYPPNTDAFKEFPSPDSLKKRIIVSTKPPKESREATAVAKKAMKDENLLKELKKEDLQEEASTAPIKEGTAGHRNIPELANAEVRYQCHCIVALYF